MSGMVREKFRFRKGRCARLGDYFSFSEKTLPCFARKSNEFGGATVLAHFSFFLAWQLILQSFLREGTSDDEPHVPFGGSKSSGVGRHGGRWSTETFTETRWVTLERGGRGFPPVF